MNAATSKVKNPRLLDGKPIRIAGFSETYTQQTMTGTQRSGAALLPISVKLRDRSRTSPMA